MILILTEADLNKPSKDVLFDRLGIEHFRIDIKTFSLADYVIIRNDKVMRVLKQRRQLESFENNNPSNVIGINKLGKFINEASQNYIGKSSFVPGTRKLKER